MYDALLWWATIELIGLAAFPVAYVLFHSLSDRGFSFAKLTGILLTAYALWLGGSLHVLPNERWTIALIVVAIAAVSAAVAARRHQEILDFLRSRWAHLLFLELIFLITFVTALLLRSYLPDLNGSERPTDSGIINALMRADSFPPQDPWLSGHDINYYYFGHMGVATLSKLTDIPTRISFNLAIASVVALAAMGVAGVAYTLIVNSVRWRFAFLFAALAVPFFLLMSNIEGLFEFMAAHGIGSAGFYDALDIRGLDGPRQTDRWYPTEPFWWGRSNSYMSGWADRLLPFNRLLISDLHSEILAMPMAALLIGLGLNLWRSAADATQPFPRPLDVAFMAFVLGAAAFTQLWDFPVYFFLLAAVFAVALLHRQGRLSWRLARRAGLFTAALLALSVLFFLPSYFVSYGSFNGITRTEALYATRFHHFLYQWLPILGLITALVVVTIGRPKRLGATAAGLGALLLAVLLPWAYLTRDEAGFAAVFDEIVDRGTNLLTIGLVVGLLAAVGLALLHQLSARPDQSGRPPVAAYPLILSGVVLLLILGVEFYWIDDPYFVPRFNTLNKVSFQGWAMVSAAGAFAAAYGASRVDWRNLRQAAAAAGIAAALGAFVLSGFVYPLTATFSVTNSFDNPRYLDGLDFMRRDHPGEYDAILWLNDNVDGTPIVLEAVGGSHTRAARVSAFTGLPTVLGWPQHVFFFRGDYDQQGTREHDIRIAYQTNDPAQARDIIEEYGVEYVYVSWLEIETYGAIDTAKFAEFMDLAYENQEVQIFRMRHDGEAAVGHP
jgi:YYY domain-containing protein